MQIWKIKKVMTAQQLREVVAILERGGLVVFPTETCYGMGVDATNEVAVRRLFEYKGGRQNKAVSVAVADETMARKYVRLNETAVNLYRQFLPGPVTVISESLGRVVPQLVSERNTLGIRMPEHPATKAILRDFGKPITATSANTSGEKPPYSWEDLERYTSKKKLSLVGGFVDVGRLPYREPSTVVDTTLNELFILRKGEIDLSLNANVRESNGPDETLQIATQLAAEIVEKLSTMPVIVAMQGELGAGKTQLVKGLAQALGITQTIVSPTYQIMREYDFKCGKVSGKLVHIDTWRLHDGAELLDLGLADMLRPGNLVAIEWMEKAKELMDAWVANKLWVTINVTGETGRVIRWVWSDFTHRTQACTPTREL